MSQLARRVEAWCRYSPRGFRNILHEQHIAVMVVIAPMLKHFDLSNLVINLLRHRSQDSPSIQA